jgi:hypothetical protein
MAQRSATQLVSNKADIQLTISSINTRQTKGSRSTAIIYSVAETTLRRRRAGILARRNCQPNSKKLTQLEEQVVTSHILNLDLRGFAPTYSAVRDMANSLLAARGAGQVGVH